MSDRSSKGVVHHLHPPYGVRDEPKELLAMPRFRRSIVRASGDATLDRVAAVGRPGLFPLS